MTWFRVDDNLAFHPKAIVAGNAALGLWVRSGSWSAQQLSDGHVPADIARGIGTKGQVDRLIDSGLWLPNGSGYVFHQWVDRQPTRAEVEKRRKAGADRLRKWREKNDDSDT